MHLVMDLKKEMGGDRGTQVQPPRSVWENYFNLNFQLLPQYTIIDRKIAGAYPENRPVVKHDHTWSIEMSGASDPEGTILWMTKIGEGSYSYGVYRPGEADFDRLNWLLATFNNPSRRSEARRWLMLY